MLLPLLLVSAACSITATPRSSTGNLAVGSHHVFLPALVKHIGSETSGASRLLLLHALKEVSQSLSMLGA